MYGEPRTNLMGFRANEEQAERIRQVAGQEGLRVAEWLRALVLREIRKYKTAS